MPLDRFARDINYLRVSVLDRCNLRCTYCMPLEGLQFLPSEELLTPAEIGAVVRAAVGAGFRKFRITGGEPTLRRDIVEIVEAMRSVPGVDELAMTTNGLLLPRLAPALAKAGLDRVNLHLDTLDAERLRQIMRFNDLDKVWRGIEAAEAAGLEPLKLNTVVVKGENENDVVPLARFTLEREWHVRFIELMPLGGGECGRYSRDRYVSNRLTRARLERELGALEPLPDQRPSDESKNFRFPGARGVIGFISPVSEPFCGGCNRLRLTADGRFHLCLLHDDEVDVRSILRSGGGESAVREVLLKAVGAKPVGHDLVEATEGVHGLSNDARHMHQIGG